MNKRELTRWDECGRSFLISETVGGKNTDIKELVRRIGNTVNGCKLHDKGQSASRDA